MRKLLLLTVVIAGVTLAGFWGGRKVCMLMWPGSLRPSQAWYGHMGLSPSQTDALQKLDRAFREQTDRVCMKICRERLALLNLMRDPKADPQVIYHHIEEIGAIQVSLEKAIATHILTAKTVLTPVQSQAYLNRIQQQLHESIEQSGYGTLLNR